MRSASQSWVVRMRLPLLLAFASVALPSAAQASADILFLSALRLTYKFEVPTSSARDSLLGGPLAPAAPTGLRVLTERFGKSPRARQMAAGIPTGGRVLLRPMFWMTRDQRGVMFALGGKY